MIHELYVQHLRELLEERAGVVVDSHGLEEALAAMAVRGDIGPFLGLFHARVVKAMGFKELRRFDEKELKLKLMMLAFLSMSRVFHPLSEKEFAQGYCDLFLGVSPLALAATYAWLLELKYLPAAAKAAQIERAFAEAEAQVPRYASDERLVPLLTRGHSLRAGSLVFVGAKRVLFRLWEAGAGEAKAPARKARTARRTAGKARAKGRARMACSTSQRRAVVPVGAEQVDVAMRAGIGDATSVQ